MPHRRQGAVGGGGAVDPTVLTRSPTSDTTTFTAGVADNGMFAGGTVLNEARITSLIGDGAEEEWIVNNGTSNGRPGIDVARNVMGHSSGIGWKVVGDFSCYARLKYASDPADAASMGVAAWHPGSGVMQDERYMSSAFKGFPDTHGFKASWENTSQITLAGATVDETVLHYTRLIRAGDLITAGWSLDGVSWTDIADEKAYDMIGNECWVGVLAGKNTVASTFAFQVDEFYLSYFPAT